MDGLCQNPLGACLKSTLSGSPSDLFWAQEGPGNLEFICMHPRGNDVEMKSLNFQDSDFWAKILILALSS